MCNDAETRTQARLRDFNPRAGILLSARVERLRLDVRGLCARFAPYGAIYILTVATYDTVEARVDAIKAIKRQAKKGVENVGRKSRYETHIEPRLGEVSEWIQLLDEVQIAKRLGVSRSCFETSKRKHPELCEALKRGRETLVEDLKMTLKKKAKGYTYEETMTRTVDEGGKITVITETKTKYAHPDTGAIHLLLKNLDDSWRNDDRETMDLRREKVQLDRERMENGNW